MYMNNIASSQHWEVLGFSMATVINLSQLAARLPLYFILLLISLLQTLPSKRYVISIDVIQAIVCECTWLCAI